MLLKLQCQLEAEQRINASFAELSQAIISPDMTESEIYEKVLNQARELTESEHGFVSSIDPQSGLHVSHTLTKMKADGCDSKLIGGIMPAGPHKLYDGLWGYGLNKREAFFTNHPMLHPASKGLPEGHVPMTNFLSVPVLFQELLLGQIALANSSRDYTEEDIENVGKLAVFYAVFLRNHLWLKELTETNKTLEEKTADYIAANKKLTKQYKALIEAEEKMRRSVEMQSVLREIAEAAVLLPSLDELYEAVHHLVGRVLPAKQFHINLLDEDAGEIVVPFNADDVTYIPVRRPIGRGMTEYIMRLGRAVHITPAEMNRLSEAGEYTLAKEQQVQTRHYLGAPLIDSQGKAFGVMSLIQMGETTSFQPEDVEILSIVAAQVSMAIERKRMETELQMLAMVDGLTGIFNRQNFLARAGEEFKRIARYGGTCSLLMIDIDHFKNVNDNFGHAVGDAAIRLVAKLCAESLRETDLLGRIGGEEFAMLLREAGTKKAEQIAERLRLSIQEEAFFSDQGALCPLRVSIGVSELQPGDETLAVVMLRADRALYQAKNEGRNCVKVNN